MRLAGPPQNFLLPRPFLCFSVSSVRFSSSFFLHKSKDQEGCGLGWTGCENGLGTGSLSILAIRFLPWFPYPLLLAAFSFGFSPLSIVWATEIAHGHRLAGGKEGFQDQAKDFSWNSKILCIWKIWNPVMLLISLHSNSSCGSPAYWGHFGSISAWVTTSNCKFSKC